MLCDIVHLKSILLYILCLCFAYLVICFIFKHKEGLSTEEQNKAAAFLAENQPTSVDHVDGVISAESKLAEQAIDDEYNTFLQKLDNIKAKQDNNNNSDTDNNKINTIKTIIDNKIENNKNIPLAESGNRIIFNNPKEKEKYITIVAKLVN